ncbi:MAG: hypothetical protein DLM59_14465 [Pseudonocardiales bacterium]|nr:MAG: hypothetical protein DLM59_14465 [Pseudonocardiales bacterium]
MSRLMVVAGRLPDGDVGPVHAHEGDEVLRVVSGRVLVRCGDHQRVCEAGELVVVPPGVLHGFRVRSPPHETPLRRDVSRLQGAARCIAYSGFEIRCVVVPGH